MTPFAIVSNNRIVCAALAGAVVVTGSIILFHPLSASSLGFGGSGSTSSTPSAYTAPTSSTVFLSEKSAASAAQAATTNAAEQEVHIANNGMTLVRGARVVSVSGNTVVITLAWGGADFTWNVQTTYGTQIYDDSGSKSSLNAIRIGDVVTVSGQLIQTSNAPSVTAQYIHDESI